jgi:hypothetical protein
MEYLECMSSYAPVKRFNCGEILDMRPNQPTFPLTSKLELCQHNANDLSRSSEVHYEVGDWVIVHYVDEYDDNEYPG